MQQLIGDWVRQLRRQRSLTQTELGGDRFSKSYVSAVERAKIVPSRDALRFFAEQLGQPGDHLEKLLEQSESMKQLSPFITPHLSDTNRPNTLEEVLTLLDLLIEGTERHNLSMIHELPALLPEIVAGLPLDKQAEYSYLMGLLAQEQGDLSTALSAFERALILAPPKHQPAILDDLGMNHYLAQMYQSALGYHKRALRLLDEEASSDTANALRLKVELHCGNDYRALGAHQQAHEHFERARRHIDPTQDMKTAGELYLGLGYCTYAKIFQNGAFTHSATARTSHEETEGEFQRAISFLLQGRTLYQVSGDRSGESSARLLQAMVLLDFSTRRRQIAQEKASETGTLPAINCAALLDEAEEQCRQVLVTWEKSLTPSGTPSAELEAILYGAVAYLIRVFAQRAALARLAGYRDTAVRELSLASHLCQKAINTFSEPVFPLTLIQDTVNLQVTDLAYHSQSLPRLSDVPVKMGTTQRSKIGQEGIYFAAGEVAEEMGRVATSPDYSRDCYARANQSFQASLFLTAATVPDKERDPTYLVRSYQRCVSILEERIQADPAVAEETTRILLDILKDGLNTLISLLVLFP